TQQDLGLAYDRLARRDDDPAARAQATGSYRAALEVYTRDETPDKWARTQSGLAGALRAQGMRDFYDDAPLAQALGAYRAAIEVWTRQSAPADWALTQNNIALTLRILASGGDVQLLRQAVAAHRAALQVFTRTSAPQDWAMVQSAMALTLQTLGEQTNDPSLVREAIDACNAALQVYTRDAAPADWAHTQLDLASAYETLVVLGDESQRATALHHARAALEGFEVSGNQDNVRLTRDWIADMEGDAP
ncbi:MAG: hypothetical protein AB7G05_12405, partial [Hyphomonadaceae bacterium]